MITAVGIAGAPLDLTQVLGEAVTVLHGRAAFDDDPSAASAELHLLIPAAMGMPAWANGDPLTIDTEHGRLFTGTVTDRRLPGHVDTLERGRCAQLELIAAGPLATAGHRMVGDEPWPQEPGSARAQRILDAAGLPGLVQIPVVDEVQVLPRDVDKQPALGLLADLCEDTGAAVVDLPDGRILYQPLECRSRPVFPVRWMDFTEAWSAFDPSLEWAGLDYISPAAQVPLDLPPSAVESEPAWVSDAARIINSIRVGYGVPPEGGEQAVEEAQHAASIARYGLRYAYLGTQLARVVDAAARASRVITTQAVERWGLADVTVWETALDGPTRAAVAALRTGDWVQVTNLPQPAPAASWAAIVEGWGYVEHRTDVTHQAWWTLALSDPLHSLAVMTWQDYPPTYPWSQHPAWVTWADIIDLASIGA